MIQQESGMYSYGINLFSSFKEVTSMVYGQVEEI